MQEFRRMSFSGYLLKEQDCFYYLSQSRLHPQRIHANKSLSQSALTDHPQNVEPCSAGAQVEEVTLGSEGEDVAAEADSEVRLCHLTVTQ